MATILYVGTAGSDDPTRAGLPFNFALGAVEAGHQPMIFLAGEAAYLMKDDVVGAVMPVAMPPLNDMLTAVIAQRVPSPWNDDGVKTLGVGIPLLFPEDRCAIPHASLER